MTSIKPQNFVIELESWPADQVKNMREFHQVINPHRNRFKDQLEKRVRFSSSYSVKQFVPLSSSEDDEPVATRNLRPRLNGTMLQPKQKPKEPSILDQFQDILPPPVGRIPPRTDDTDSISGDSSSTYHSCDEDLSNDEFNDVEVPEIIDRNGISYEDKLKHLQPPELDLVRKLPNSTTVKCDQQNCSFVTTNERYLLLHKSSHCRSRRSLLA